MGLQGKDDGLPEENTGHRRHTPIRVCSFK